VGGCGLVITEGVGVDHQSALGDAGLGENQIPIMYGGAALAGWKRVVEKVHAAGSRIIPQLWHQGVMRIAGTGPNPSAPTIGPSGLWGPIGRTALEPEKVPKDPFIGPAMTEEDIADVISSFTRAARAAKSVGFDGIALHGAHGYLLDNFLWEGTNTRSDGWGGNRKRRTEAVVHVVRGVRAAIGPDLPIFFRFSQWKQQDLNAQLAGTPSELEEILGPLADAGVDVFDASVRYFDRAAFPDSDLNLAGWAKKLTGQYSMAVGGIGLGVNKGPFGGGAPLDLNDNLRRVQYRLERGEFDLIALGRALIADAKWPMKVQSGQTPETYSRCQLDALI